MESGKRGNVWVEVMEGRRGQRVEEIDEMWGRMDGRRWKEKRRRQGTIPGSKQAQKMK